MAPNQLQTDFSFSDADIQFYEEHGWIKTPVILPDELIEEALAGLQQHWSGHRDRRLDGAGEHFIDWMPGDPSGTRNNEYLSLQNDKFAKLALSPIIGKLAASLTRSQSVRLFDDQMFYKPGPDEKSVIGWHVDGDYWFTCTSQKMLTAWIPLHDCPEELGPLVVADGSHKWSHLLDRSIYAFHRENNSLAQAVEALGYEFKPLTMSLQRGQFSFHNCRTIHGSQPNRGSSPRIAAAVHLQDGANSYRASVAPNGRTRQFNDMICRSTASGHPDYTDESVFPVLWNSESRGAIQNA